jgi:diguanylate cyclase (GGDEF)-like protein
MESSTPAENDAGPPGPDPTVPRDRRSTGPSSLRSTVRTPVSSPLPEIRRRFGFSSNIAYRVFLAMGIVWASFMVTTFVSLMLISELDIHTEVRRITLFLSVMAIVGGATGAASSIMLIRGIVRPIRQLTEGVEALSRREDDVLLTIDADDELDLLARTISQMYDDRRKSEARLEDLAHFDPLTKLPNRTLFHIRLNEALSNSERTGQMVAVQLLDLDDFKTVNDTLGHPAGDRLLQEIADRLSDCVRDTDTVARLGGDEFVIIQNHLNEVVRVETLAQRVIDRVREPVRIGNDHVHSGTSVGITIYPLDAREPDELLRNADLALYHAKKENHGGFYLYDQNLDSEVKAKTALERELRKALDGDQQLHLVYQPKADLNTGAIIGAEALIRWRHPDQGMIPPNDFIPVAEQSGLIQRITEFVIERVGHDTAAWPYADWPGFRISVNLSAIDLKRSDFNDWLREILQRTEFASENLELEITEHALIDNVDRTRETLNTLQEGGVELSVDDFGTGYSSLSYLKNFPLDCLKIDRSFIQDIPGNQSNASIAKSVITMSHGLGMRVIAEGVEDEDQAAFLRHEGCDQIQGYILSAPLLPDAFLEFCETKNEIDTISSRKPC